LQALLTKLSEQGLSSNSSLLTSDQETTRPDSLLSFSFPWYAQNARRDVKPRRALVLKALVGLALFDTILSIHKFHGLLARVESWPTKQRRTSDTKALIADVCAAVEHACAWYPKRAVCLQRSAITTGLLRSLGVEAQMIIGVRATPLFVHV
jgi:hypothetical protein